MLNIWTAADVKALRQKLKLTQENFAHRLGVSFTMVNRWENERERPQRKSREKLARLAKRTNGGRRR